MKILGNEIKPGMIIEHKDDLWSVLKTQHVKPGKGGAFNQVELKGIKKGTKLNVLRYPVKLLGMMLQLLIHFQCRLAILMSSAMRPV